MCGIFGYVGNKKNAATIVFDGLKTLEYRGYDSWGVATLDQNNKIQTKKRAGKIGDNSIAELPNSTIAFGHTRWATHGGVTQTNAHPHLDCSGELAIIHNGIIENYEEIKKSLHNKHTFISETDTEVAIHLIEELAQTLSLTEAVRHAFNRFEGLNAIIILDSKNHQLIAARNGSPLVIGFGASENFLASDASALLPHTKEVHFMEDNEMAVMNNKTVDFYDVVSRKPHTVTKQTLSWKIEEASLGTFPHFMLKEIHEQPKIIAEIVASGMHDAKRVSELIKHSFGTYVVGCGTASYAALAGSYLFSKIAKIHINWAIGSEFGYHLDFLKKKSLVVALSQSGETMDILESVKKAKERGATILALVNVLGSSLYRISDEKVLLGAGPEKAVASTKAFVAKLSYLVLIAYSLANKADTGQKIVTKAIESTKKILNQHSINNIQKLAKAISNKSHVYVIGRGLSYPASLEAALKIKEISYIHAEGLAAGELKHGPLALVESGTPCIAYLPNDETYGANLAGAMEMKARGGEIIGISFKNHPVFDHFIEVEDAQEATIIPNVVVAQLLAYYLSIARDLDPDKPRNLAKSVTVK